MSKFYLYLWLKWCLRVSICSITMAVTLSFLITSYLYINQGMPSIDNEIFKALLKLFYFWFPISWSLTLLIAMFRSLKYIFNTPLNGYKIELLTCTRSDIIDPIGYGNLVKVCRKWFMLIIWLVTAEIILSLIFTSIFMNFKTIFEWFDIYFLFIFILIAGYLSFILLGGRCKQIKVSRC